MPQTPSDGSAVSGVLEEEGAVRKTIFIVEARNAVIVISLQETPTEKVIEPSSVDKIEIVLFYPVGPTQRGV